jgi:DNA-binding GntR family transcriptional regulator
MPKFTLTQKSGYQTKQEYVYQILRNAIMSCELSPGEKLVISDIAEKLAVSTIPVREALQSLNSEELVTYSAHSGAIVAKITKESIFETFLIKEGLECVAIRVITDKIKKETVENLKKQLAEMDKILETKNYTEWGKYNAEFHTTIVRLAEMPTLLKMYSSTVDKWSRVHKYYFSESLNNNHLNSQEEHYLLLQAIISRNCLEAERLTKIHNQNSLNFYMSKLNGDSIKR